jgi:hypothetical protein
MRWPFGFPFPISIPAGTGKARGRMPRARTLRDQLPVEIAVSAASTPRLESTGFEYLRLAFMLLPRVREARLASATLEKAIPGCKSLSGQRFLAWGDARYPVVAPACLRAASRDFPPTQPLRAVHERGTARN